MATLNVELYIHCKPCMEETKMEKSLMVFVGNVLFDKLTIGTYECPNCKHRIEVEVSPDMSAA